MKVKLEKQGKTFGFTVAGGMNTGGCYVKQIVTDLGPANIRPGDKIVQVSHITYYIIQAVITLGNVFS